VHQLERKRLITYRWWREGGRPIVPKHIPLLEESALESIAELMRQEYRAGELCDEMADGRDNDVEYRGWWSVDDIVD